MEDDGLDEFYEDMASEADMAETPPPAGANSTPPRRPRPDFDPRIDYPERYSDGPY